MGSNLQARHCETVPGFSDSFIKSSMHWNVLRIFSIHWVRKWNHNVMNIYVRCSFSCWIEALNADTSNWMLSSCLSVQNKTSECWWSEMWQYKLIPPKLYATSVKCIARRARCHVICDKSKSWHSQTGRHNSKLIKCMCSVFTLCYYLMHDDNYAKVSWQHSLCLQQLSRCPLGLLARSLVPLVPLIRWEKLPKTTKPKW